MVKYNIPVKAPPMLVCMKTQHLEVFHAVVFIHKHGVTLARKYSTVMPLASLYNAVMQTVINNYNIPLRELPMLIA